MKRLSIASVFMAIFTLLLNICASNISSANPLSNTIAEKPNLSSNIEIILIDTSRSVDKSVVLEGLRSVREKIAEVYERSGKKYDSPASSYYFWLHILGQNDTKNFSPLFASNMDQDIWSLVRKTVGGRTNEIKTLSKIRSDSGVWKQLIMAGNLDNCPNYVAGQIKTAGLYGKSLFGVSTGLCNEAFKARSNFSNMFLSTSDYLSGIKSNNGGSDIFGTIERINEEMTSTQGLKGYKKVKLVFVTDGINNTKDYALRNLLSKPNTDACNLGRDKAVNEPKYNSKKVFVKMYGIGEGRENQEGKGRDNLKPELKEYWKCYWLEKGIENPEFGQLSELKEVD